MPVSAVRILVVGHTSPRTLAILQRLEREGWSAHRVDTIAEAEEALKTIRFDVVLASETIGEGSGYDLTDTVLLRGKTLLVSIALSEASLWLPVVQRGKLTLGDRALNSAALPMEIAELLSEPVRTRESVSSREALGWVAHATARESFPTVDRRVGPRERRERTARGGTFHTSYAPPRRKSAALDSVSIPDEVRIKLKAEKTLAVPNVPRGHFRQHPARAPNRH